MWSLESIIQKIHTPKAQENNDKQPTHYPSQKHKAKENPTYEVRSSTSYYSRGIQVH